MRPEEDFARRFEAVWDSPSTERLVALLAPDAVLVQPHHPPMRSQEAARREFDSLFRWLPGFCGEVKRWHGSDGVVLIEWKMKFPIGRKPTWIPAVDRFVLDEDGLARERVAYFNPLPLFMAVAARPYRWPGYLRYKWASR